MWTLRNLVVVGAVLGLTLELAGGCSDPGGDCLTDCGDDTGVGATGGSAAGHGGRPSTSGAAGQRIVGEVGGTNPSGGTAGTKGGGTGATGGAHANTGGANTTGGAGGRGGSGAESGAPEGGAPEAGAAPVAGGQAGA